MLQATVIFLKYLLHKQKTLGAKMRHEWVGVIPRHRLTQNQREAIFSWFFTA